MVIVHSGASEETKRELIYHHLGPTSLKHSGIVTCLINIWIQ